MQNGEGGKSPISFSKTLNTYKFNRFTDLEREGPKSRGK
jgi:hypothetical protein